MDFPPSQKGPVAMNPNILHPCGRLFALEQSIATMSQDQLRLGGILGEAIEPWDSPAMSEAVETVCMHAIVMAGIAKRLRELRHELSAILP
jgi:hypothetical protein